jgi:OFA family oxalate/formate antiporter-like MFS transporter
MNKRLILTACFLTVFIAYAVRYGYGILLPEMLKSLDITKTDAGIIYSSFFIAYTIASPVCGYISDRYGSRWLLASFTIAIGIGAFLMSQASTILQASLFFTLAGIGCAAGWAPVIALAQKWTSPEHRGRTVAFIDIASALSIIAMGVLVPVIVRVLDWRAGWMILGGIGIGIGILNFLIIKNPPDTGQNNEVKSAGMPLATLLKSGKFWLLGLGYLFTGFAIQIPFTFLNTYAVRELAFSYDTAAIIFTVLGVGAIISKVSIGPWSDKTGRLKMMFLCGFLIVLGCLGMAYRNVVTLFISVFIFSMGYGVVWALYAAAASDYFARDSAGTIVGLWTLFLGVGLVVSPVISGWLADTTGTLTWSFVLGAVGGLMSIIMLVPLSLRRV